MRFTGGIGSVGVDDPEDPAGPTAMGKHGEIVFDYGMHWVKGQTMGSGQCPAEKYNRRLRDLIAAGTAKPSRIVSHQLPPEQAPEAYQHFDARDEGWTQVILESRLASA